MIQQKQKAMKAIINYTNGTRAVVIVNSAYSQGGVLFYNITRNALNTFLDFESGETVLVSAEVEKLTYIMG